MRNCHIVGIQLPRVHGVITGDPHYVERLLYSFGKPFCYERGYIFVDIFTWLTKMNHQFLDCQSQECGGSSRRLGINRCSFVVVRLNVRRHIRIGPRRGTRHRIDVDTFDPKAIFGAVIANTDTQFLTEIQERCSLPAREGSSPTSSDERGRHNAGR